MQPGPAVSWAAKGPKLCMQSVCSVQIYTVEMGHWNYETSPTKISSVAARQRLVCNYTFFEVGDELVCVYEDREV